MLRAAALVLLGLTLLPATLRAEPCRPGEPPRKPAAGRPGCDQTEKLKPYDPETQRAGRQPGFIDLGNGTEVRVGGRVQMDYDTRRR